jgi:CRAL/TRIO domain
VIAPLLDPRTRDKIIILGTDYKDRLLQDIDAEQLPVQYGGTCTVPLHDSSTERAVRALVQSNLPAADTTFLPAVDTTPADITSTATDAAGAATTCSGAESNINSDVGADNAVNNAANSSTTAAATTGGTATAGAAIIAVTTADKPAAFSS